MTDESTTESDYELFGVPVPLWLGEAIEEILAPTALAICVWVTVGLLLAMAAFVVGLGLAYRLL